MSLTGSGFNWSDKLIVTKSGRNNSRESTRALTSILSGRWTAIVDDWIISDNYETQSREAFQFRYAIQVKRARSVDGRQFFFFFFEHRESIAEPSSRDPMVESTTSGSSSDTNEPVCAQLLTQLNTAYQHLAPDAQALVSSVLWKFTYSWNLFAALRDSVSRDELDRTDTARSWKSVGVVILVQLSRV